MAASRAHRRELRETRQLDPPALVVREMNVEGIDLVPREQIERPQHHGLRMEVTGDVEHESAIAKARCVDHANRREVDTTTRRWPGGRQHAAQRLETVEDAGGRYAHDANALGGIHDQ